jgi:hypothetical protein
VLGATPLPVALCPLPSYRQVQVAPSAQLRQQ